MRDGDDAALEIGEVSLEPGDALGVEMVRRLVEEEHVRLLEQHAAEGDASLLSSR